MSGESIWSRLWRRATEGRTIGFGLERLGYLTLKYPRAMWLVVIALTALSATQIPRANLDGDLLRVYADSGKQYDTYKQLADTFGTFENDIYLLVTSPRMTDPGVLERMRELALELSLNDYAAGSRCASPTAKAARHLRFPRGSPTRSRSLRRCRTCSRTIR
jgi:uncharacterized protein